MNNIFRLCFVSHRNMSKILVNTLIYPSAFTPMLNKHLTVQIRCKHSDIELTNNSNKNPSKKPSKTKKEPLKSLFTIIKSGDSKKLRDKLSEGFMPDLNKLDKKVILY